MKNKKIGLMCLTGMFTALIFVFTAYLHIPSHTGYTHVGDGFIYLAASLLPLPYAVFSGAVGALLADCFTGFAIWAPASVIIKSVSVMFFSSKGEKTLSRRNLLALVFSAAACVCGYYLYESLITGNFISPLAGIPGYIVQSVLSSALFVAVVLIFDKLDMKQTFIGGKTK